MPSPHDDATSDPLAPTTALEAALRHRTWVRALAASLVGESALADDVAQEAWTRAIASPPPGDATWRSWLGGVVRNVVRDTRRSNVRRTRREAESARSEAQESSSELLERVEEEGVLVRLVLDLDEPYRSTVLRRYFDGWTVARIAQECGAPEPTVRTRLRRGLAQLRARIESDRGPGAARWLASIAALPFGRVPAVAAAAPLAVLPAVLLTMKTLAVLAIAVVSVLLALRLSRGTDPEGVLPAPITEVTRLAVLTGVPGAGLGGSQSAPGTRVALVDRAANGGAAADAVTGARIVGQVLEGGVPVSAPDLELRVMAIRASGAGMVSAPIGADGRFEMTVPDGVAVLGDMVTVGLGGDMSFGAAAVQTRLRPTMLVDLPPVLRLRGRIVTTPRGMIESGWVRINEWAGEGRDIYLGRTEFGADGRFEVLARPHPWVESGEIIVYAGGRRLSGIDVRLSALTSEAGMTFDFEVCRAAFRVVDESGTPVAGAKIALDRRSGSEFEVGPQVAGDDGRVTCLVDPDEYEYAVIAKGFVPAIGQWSFDASDDSDAEREIVLIRCATVAEDGATLVLRGVITLDDGSPIEGAFVHASAMAESWSVGHSVFHSGVRTDAEGRYELSFPRPGSYGVTVYHASGGFSAKRPIRIPTDLALDIELRRQVELSLVPAGEVLELHAFYNYVDWCVVDVPGGAFTRWVGHGVHSFEARVGREYCILARVEGSDLIAIQSIPPVVVGDQGPISIPFRSAPIVEGILRDLAGRPVVGATVTASPGESFASAPRGWRTSKTDEDGAFRTYALGGVDGDTHCTLSVRLRSGGARFELTAPIWEHSVHQVDVR